MEASALFSGLGDFSSGSFLSNLERVDHNLELDIGNPVPTGMLPRLRTVDRDATVRARFLAPATLADLQTVGGDLMVEGRSTHPIDASGGSGRILGALNSVGGTLAFRYDTGLLRAFDVGASGLTAAALSIRDTQQTSFSSATVQVVGAGEIRIQDNPSLCASAIDAFLLGQTSWTGTSVRSGNAGC